MMTPMWISLFKVLLLLFAFFATTSADTAPFMPIPTQHDYPDLSGLTHKLKNNFAKFFSNDLQPTDVSSRVGGSDERFLCRSIRKLVYPKKGLRADDTWQLIVNNDEYKQAIQIEECEGADQPCDFAANFPQSYNPICKQHYTQQTLASIKSDGELDVVQNSFKIPSCCKCALKTG
nr:spatzle alternatively spliced isoform 11.32 [Drosophila melanogaster]